MRLGKEQFRNAITEFRNMHIVAAMRPLMTMRSEVIGNDEFQDRGGSDSPTAKHLKSHLVNCDRMRRHVTHNPDKLDLGDKIAKAIDATATIEIGENPFGGDDIQNQSGGLIDLPWALDGTDPNIPLTSQLDPKFIQSNGLLILGAIDRTIVNWTRMNSKDRTVFITAADSMRIYGQYQQILGFINMYLGDANRVDVAQLLPGEEPQGLTASPNLLGEVSNGGPSA